jgi:hypothetical protein
VAKLPSSEGCDFRSENGDSDLNIKNNSYNKNNFLESSDRKVNSGSYSSSGSDSCDCTLRQPSNEIKKEN